MLRGVNLSGNSKIPTNYKDLRNVREFFSARSRVTFVNRPFPLEECEEHFARLKSWGFTFNRLVVPWEAIEHEGPGIYDNEYLKFLEEFVKHGRKFGLSFYIDPHQDLFSRLCGGDGAPAWTLDKVGLNPDHFIQTCAAVFDPKAPLDDKEWPSNYIRMATATMFTLFFGGNDFAPKTLIDGVPVQDYLQGHFFNAYKKVAEVLKPYDNVVAFGTINEPYPGYIGWKDLNAPADVKKLKIGPTPTPFQSMLLGDGVPQKVGVWKIIFGPMVLYKKWINKDKVRAWKEGHECIWKQNGVWGYDPNGNAILMKPDHFWRPADKEIEFGRDYLKPFMVKFTNEMRSVNPNLLVFIQSTPMYSIPRWESDDGDPSGIANSSHWYDYFAIFTGIYLPFFSMDFYKNGKFVFGREKQKKMFYRQLGEIEDKSVNDFGGMPTIIGEFGIKFRLPFGLSHIFSGNIMHNLAMNASFRAIERRRLNATIWNYTPSNTLKNGDGWNKEDLSIFSRELIKKKGDLNSGARALKAFLRPYPMATVGVPTHVKYNMRSKKFSFEFVMEDEATYIPTVIFVPNYLYPNGIDVTILEGHYEHLPNLQELHYYGTPNTNVHRISIKPKKVMSRK